MKTYLAISVLSACLGAGVTHYVHAQIEDRRKVEEARRSKEAMEKYFHFEPQKDKGNKAFSLK